MSVMYVFVDVDECVVRNGGCSQLCVNSYGSYKCCCNVGYVLSNNEQYCEGKTL
jgi:hypothetical protein